MIYMYLAVGARVAATVTLRRYPMSREKEKPRKMVGGAKSHLESNPLSARDAQRAQTYLVCTRTQDPTETETELCLSVSCKGTGQQWPSAGTGLWVQQTWV